MRALSFILLAVFAVAAAALPTEDTPGEKRIGGNGPPGWKRDPIGGNGPPGWKRDPIGGNGAPGWKRDPIGGNGAPGWKRIGGNGPPGWKRTDEAEAIA